MAANETTELERENADTMVGIRVTESEKAEIERAAAGDDRTVSAWGRRILRDAARRALGIQAGEGVGSYDDARPPVSEPEPATR